MQDKHILGMDLPLKDLAWEDEQDKSWLSYNDTNRIAERHALSTNSEPVIKAITEAMTAVPLVLRTSNHNLFRSLLK